MTKPKPPAEPIVGDVVMMDPNELKPYNRNPRNNDKAVPAVAKSISRFGFPQPIVVDAEFVVIVGHTRRLAAIDLGLTAVPVIVAHWLSDDAARAYRIADNQVGEIATWEKDLLGGEVKALEHSGVDLDSLGFDEKQLATLLRPEGEAEQDEIPEVPKKPKTKPGDLYELGQHRLLCGDAESPADVARVLDGAAPFLMVTDPPYGVDYDADWRDEAEGIDRFSQSATSENVINDNRADWREVYKLAPSVVAYVWHAGVKAGTIADGLVEAGFDIRGQIIWKKPVMIIGRGAYHWQHEPCWYAAKGSAGWSGDRKQTTIWEIQGMHAMGREETREDHPTQKPVEAMARPIRNHAGGLNLEVYDPFLGSGTTLIAAEQLGRPCYGLEISPGFCDVIVARWETATGNKAKRRRG